MSNLSYALIRTVMSGGCPIEVSCEHGFHSKATACEVLDKIARNMPLDICVNKKGEYCCQFVLPYDNFKLVELKIVELEKENAENTDSFGGDTSAG